MNIRHFGGSGRAWVLLRDGASSSANGSWDDNKTAKRLHEQLGRPVFYFRLGDHAWIVDDPKLIHQIEMALEPGAALVRRQQELAATQTAVGVQQARTGARMGGIGGRMAAPGANTAEVRALMAAAQAEMDALAEEQRRLGGQQVAVGNEQHEAARRADAAIDALMEDAIVNDVARPLT